MSSLLDTLDPAIAVIAPSIDKVTWAEKAIVAGEARAASMTGPEGASVRSMIEVVKDNTEVLASVPGRVFAAMAAHLALGDQAAAHRTWLAGVSLDQQLAQLDADDAAVGARLAQNAAMKAEVERVALTILAAGGKAALPFLLAAIGV